MKLFLKWPWRMAVASCFAVALVGCSSQTRHSLLCVFFTGVDEPVVVSVPNPSVVNTNTPLTTNTNLAGPIHYFHKPYEERKCFDCHLSVQSQELRAIDGELCLKCHDKLIGDAKVVHQPIDDGKCLTCHQPHESLEPFLLTKKGQAVCLACHKMAKLEKVKQHANMGETLCTTCHDPHRSDFKALLRKEWP